MLSVSAARRLVLGLSCNAFSVRLTAPSSNASLLRRVLTTAAVIYGVGMLVLHYLFGWSWFEAVPLSVVLGVGAVVGDYRRYRR